jgi:hypothetical protein
MKATDYKLHQRKWLKITEEWGTVISKIHETALTAVTPSHEEVNPKQNNLNNNGNYMYHLL